MEGWPVGSLHKVARGLPRTNPGTGKVEELNQETPDCKSSTLRHLAMLLWTTLTKGDERNGYLCKLVISLSLPYEFS